MMMHHQRFSKEIDIEYINLIFLKLKSMITRSMLNPDV